MISMLREFFSSHENEQHEDPDSTLLQLVTYSSNSGLGAVGLGDHRQLHLGKSTLVIRDLTLPDFFSWADVLPGFDALS